MAKVVWQFKVYADGNEEGEPDKSIVVEVNPIEGTREQQPVLCVHDRASGLDARIAFPKGDYSDVPTALASLGEHSDDIERAVRKVVSLFNLIL